MDAALGLTASTADRGCLATADLIICNNTAMESDHLILNVDVIAPVRDGGAKLIVANSTLDPADEHLGTLTVDPLRGRASYFWNAVLQELLDSGDLKTDGLEGAAEFLAGRDSSIDLAAAKAGVQPEQIQNAADLVRAAKNIVVVHGVDRTQDASAGDLEIFANLVALLEASSRKAEILLPRQLANSAGLEVMGADPAFVCGKVAAPELPGARDSQQLREILEAGNLRGALIIGENPLEHDRPGSWFQNIEFLVAMDWTETETTRFADITLPGSTYLETEGTRCNFEGKVLEYSAPVKAPSGVPGDEVLRSLAAGFGLHVAAELTENLHEETIAQLGDRVAFYWNTGQERVRPTAARLVPVILDARAASIRPALTHTQQYRKEIREVGTERFRVRH